MYVSKLRHLKSVSGKTTKQISQESGIPEPTLEKLFMGAVKDPRLSTVQAVVNCLGFTLDDLVTDESNKKEAQGMSPEPRVSPTTLARLLELAGIVEPGRDLTDADLKFMQSVILSITYWFADK